MEHPIQDVMKTTMENIKQMIDVNTIVGDAVETADGTVIIPISRVSFGFVSGGGEYGEIDKGSQKDTEQQNNDSNNDTSGNSANSNSPFAGGSGAGVSLNPMAFLVVNQGNIKLMPVHYNSPFDRIVEMMPQVIDKLQNYMDKNKESDEEKEHPDKDKDVKAEQ